MTRTRGRVLVVRLLVAGAALTLWFWTQSLISKHALPTSGIGDQLLLRTAPINSYLYEHHRAANALLIMSSAIIDLEGIFLLARWIFGPSIRPFLGLLLALGLRQLMQVLVALPPPENMIWHYPGFPSLLVTYGVANDYYFSGHTAIATPGKLAFANSPSRSSARTRASSGNSGSVRGSWLKASASAPYACNRADSAEKYFCISATQGTMALQGQ